MSHLFHVFQLISLHELTPITDAYQWNAHDHLERTIRMIDTQVNFIQKGTDMFLEEELAQNFTRIF